MNNVTESKQNQESEIWAHNLTKIYGKGESAVKAVKGIDLFVKRGVHGFLGPNGAGKTTTMNMLIGAISI
ncbi:MAG: ABC transporter ATP-binding protein, partial [Candidatus Lokiarchaeota archaeon]